MTPPAVPAERGARLRRLLCAVTIAALAVPAGARSQQEPAAAETTQEAAEPGSELTVYLMTIGQGDAVWERFGHNAIWMHDAARQTEIAYNYGIFVFGPGFYSRFLRGDMMYRMEPMDGPASAEAYAASNRSVWLQELNLTPAQRLKLRDFLEWNALPENKFYQYDYFHDNCSTRVRDALDYALDGTLRASAGGRPTGTSFRWHSLRLTAPQLATSTGLLLGLGPFADQPIDAWEESFIPMRLMAHARDVRVPGPDGVPVPLVRSERQLFQATRAPEADRPPQPTIAYLTAGLLIAGAILLLGRVPAGFLALGIAWSVAAGFFGVVLAALWAFTSHVATYYNENVFQLNPLSLVVAALLPFARRTPALRAAAIVASLIAAVSIFGLVLQALPGFDQVNGGIIALALPPNVALAAALVWMLKRRTKTSHLAMTGGRERVLASPHDDEQTRAQAAQQA